MRRFIYLFLGFLLTGFINLHAQDEGENSLDSLNRNQEDTMGVLAKMPIYNPKTKDAKLRILKPEGYVDNMPILGLDDSLSIKRIPYSGKNLLEDIPGKKNKKQESDPAKQK